MKINEPQITTSFERSGLIIKLRDDTSSNDIAEIKISAKNLALAFSGLYGVECEAKIFNIDKINKKMEHKKFEFEIGKDSFFNRKEIAIEKIKNTCPEGWIPDMYFSSQDSFFTKNEKDYARCTIRRWV